MAYVMGEDGNLYDTEGEDFETVGAGRPPPRPVAAPRGSMLRLPGPPTWRQGIAPGVALPQESMEQLPLTPSVNNGIFTSAVNSIIFSARPQRPFRGERPLVIVARSGTSAAGVSPIARPGIFVGTQIVGADLGDTALEAFGPQAFGVRMVFPQATPGMLIQIPVYLTGALTPGDTLTVSMFIIGKSIRLPLGATRAYQARDSRQNHRRGHSQRSR